MPDFDIQPVRESDRALFRAHAAARLRGDLDEGLRLVLQIGEERRTAHLLFVLYLFTRAVHDEYGDTPDPGDVAELTRRLHERHYRPGGEFRAIRAEAMVRGVCGESPLLTEVPVAEQPAYMWAVIAELTGPDATDAEIADLLDRAEATGAEITGSGRDRPTGARPARRRAPEPRSGAETPGGSGRSGAALPGTGVETGLGASDRPESDAPEASDRTAPADSAGPAGLAEPAPAAALTTVKPAVERSTAEETTA